MGPLNFYNTLIQNDLPRDDKVICRCHTAMRSLGAKKQLELMKKYPNLFRWDSIMTPKINIVSEKRKLTRLFNNDPDWLKYINRKTIGYDRWAFLIRYWFNESKKYCPWSTLPPNLFYMFERIDPTIKQLLKYKSELTGDNIDQYVLMVQLELE